MHVTYKVVQWGTGNLGTSAMQSIIKHPDLDLIGAWVSSAAKEGRDDRSWFVLRARGRRYTVEGRIRSAFTPPN
jgi:hypothetical protein